MRHPTTRQYTRLVDEWVSTVGLKVAEHGTHSMHRKKHRSSTKRPATCGPSKFCPVTPTSKALRATSASISMMRSRLPSGLKFKHLANIILCSCRGGFFVSVAPFRHSTVDAWPQSVAPFAVTNMRFDVIDVAIRRTFGVKLRLCHHQVMRDKKQMNERPLPKREASVANGRNVGDFSQNECRVWGDRPAVANVLNVSNMVISLDPD